MPESLSKCLLIIKPSRRRKEITVYLLHISKDRKSTYTSHTNVLIRIQEKVGSKSSIITECNVASVRLSDMIIRHMYKCSHVSVSPRTDLLDPTSSINADFLRLALCLSHSNKHRPYISMWLLKTELHNTFCIK